MQDPNAINAASLDKIALDYVTDRAVIIEWYVDHPAELQKVLRKNAAIPDGDTGENELIRYYNEQQIFDNAGNAANFFDLPDAKRHTLMEGIIKVDAQLLTEKYRLLANSYADDQEENRNAVTDNFFTTTYKEGIDFDVARAQITDQDPYYRILEEHNARNLAAARMVNTNDLDPDLEISGGFLSWTLKTIKNTIDAGTGIAKTIINVVPIFIPLGIFFPDGTLKINPTDFVNKMRADLQPGRVLVSLPAGVISGAHITLFSNGLFDVGHAAIVSKFGKDIPAQVSNDYDLTVGTNSDKGMHREGIYDSWTHHHGAAVLMQACDNVYRQKADGSYSWERVDFENTPIYNKINSVIGKPYSKFFDMLTINVEAPNYFICSSSVWWAIKSAHGDKADITPGFNSTFPNDIFKSSKMRVILKTF